MSLSRACARQIVQLPYWGLRRGKARLLLLRARARRPVRQTVLTPVPLELSRAGTVRTLLGNALRSSVLGCVLFVAQTAAAQDLAKAFDDAINALKANPRGTCDGIPYADLREECNRKGNEVTKWCKSGPDYEGPRRCGSDMDPKRTQAEIEKLKERRDIARAAREELDRRRSSLTDDAAKRAVADSITEADRTIGDAEREQATLKQQVDDATRRINDRVQEWTYCRDYREQAMPVFEKATSQVKSESDTALAQRVKELVSLLEATVPGHRRQIEEVGNTIQTCKDMLYEIGRLGHLSPERAPGSAFGVEYGLAVSTAPTCRGVQLGQAGSMDRHTFVLTSHLSLR